MEQGLFLTALLFGLATSLHCIGMCGPIALAVPVSNDSKLAKVLGAFLYNIGRAITYAIMGAVFGLLGKGFEMAGFQKWISIVIGAIMILLVLFPMLYKNRFDLENSSFSFIGKVKVGIGKLLQKRSFSSLFFLGMLNGLLPCGMVYYALLGAIASGSSFSGALFMFVFGLGTLPMLFAITVMKSAISLKLRKRLTKLVPAFIMFFGVLFILRGLGLGIPYISPKDKMLKLPEKTEKATPKCCHE